MKTLRFSILTSKKRAETLFFGSIIFVVGKSPMDIMEPILL